MKIIYKQGDLLAASEPALLHGCNTQGVMGAGVAKAIRAHYPKAYDAYHDRFVQAGLRLGQTIWVQCRPHMVINAITQDSHGNDGSRFVSYDAVRMVMREVNQNTFFQSAEKAVAMPKIGAGLGGGDWNLIAEIIEEEFTMIQPVVYVVEQA